MSVEASAPHAEGTPPAKRRKVDFTTDIVVLVGKSQQRFVVHKNILCGSSDFFKIALGGEWKEAKDQQVNLKEADVGAFGIYITWLYTAKLEVCDDGETESLSGLVSRRFVNAYTLGHFLGDRRFSNSVVDETVAVQRTKKHLPGLSMVRKSYEQLPRDSGLCRLLVDFYVCYASWQWFENNIRGLPAAFIEDMAKVGVKERHVGWEDRVPDLRAKCHYHEHKDDSDKCV